MSASAVALTWVAGLLIGFLVTIVVFLRREVSRLRQRQRKLEEAVEHQDARLFCIEQEQRWLASRRDEQGESVSG